MRVIQDPYYPGPEDPCHFPRSFQTALEYADHPNHLNGLKLNQVCVHAAPIFRCPHSAHWPLNSELRKIAFAARPGMDPGCVQVLTVLYLPGRRP